MASKLPSTLLTISYEFEYTSTSRAPWSRIAFIPASKVSYSTSLLDALKPNLKRNLHPYPFWCDYNNPSPRSYGIGCVIHKYFPRSNVHMTHNPHFSFRGEFYDEVCEDLAFDRTSGPILYINLPKSSPSLGYPAHEVRSL